MFNIRAFIANFFGKLAAIAAFFFLAMAEGTNGEKIKNLEQEKEDNAEAKAIQDKVTLDPEYRANVRELFRNHGDKP